MFQLIPLYSLEPRTSTENKCKVPPRRILPLYSCHSCGGNLQESRENQTAEPPRTPPLPNPSAEPGTLPPAPSPPAAAGHRHPSYLANSVHPNAEVSGNYCGELVWNDLAAHTDFEAWACAKP